MIAELVNNLVEIKRTFSKNYTGNAHIQEILPLHSSKKFPINEQHLQKLHIFAQKNPIYFNSYEENISGIPCMVYEGDINDYWLNSIKHGSSCQPFYPTWIMSAYIMAFIAKQFDYSELIDIGSGDGRIAYCGNFLGLNSYSIEIDDVLVDLQKTISLQTNENFNPKCADALEFDYSKLQLNTPAFFIGGLAQMGGDVLASGIIEKIKSINNLKENTGIVFAGTNSKRQLSGNLPDGGWNSLINRFQFRC